MSICVHFFCVRSDSLCVVRLFTFYFDQFKKTEQQKEHKKEGTEKVTIASFEKANEYFQ